MSDEADKAHDIEERQRDQAIASRVVYQGVSASECIDCGLEIPSKRQLAVPGTQFCVECAGMAEVRR